MSGSNDRLDRQFAKAVETLDIELSSSELADARTAVECFDGALMDLGVPPLGENQHVRWVHRAELPIKPSVVLAKEEAAPLQFYFYSILDMSVGPHNEIIDEVVAKMDRASIRALYRRILTSEIDCGYGRWSSTIAFRDPASTGAPWRRLRTFPAGGPPYLEPHHEPFVRL